MSVVGGIADLLLAGRYELLEVAGEGGMAVVWRANLHGAADFTRPVAVKKIHPHLSNDPQFLALFVEEARVGSLLDHPNIVRVYEFAKDERGEFFLVMEWVEGIDVAGWSNAHTKARWYTPWPVTCAIMAEAASALHAAHTRIDNRGQLSPTFHRDVTPGNILLSINGHVKLADFGLSRAMDRAKMTAPQILKGKLAYLAPEMLRDNQPTAQSDLYSLGVVLWETLSARRLFQGKDDADTLQRVSACQIPPLADIRPDLPEALLHLVSCLLSRQPDERPESAIEVHLLLKRLLSRLQEPSDTHTISQSVRRIMQGQSPLSKAESTRPTAHRGH